MESESITHFQSASPSPGRRPNKASRVSPPETSQPARPKKLPKAAIEATADVFMALFISLPSAVKWRIVQKIEDYEDEVDAQEFVKARAASPESSMPEKGVPFDQVMTEYEVLHNVKLT